MHKPEWVLGTNFIKRAVKFVKKGDKDQFVFEQAQDFLKGKLTQESKSTLEIYKQETPKDECSIF